jgi:truncated hemoglobin YjbI
MNDQPAKVYGAIGGAAGCHALATAFYAHVERDPILRPLFPSTFTCAIEAFSAFLVQFLCGEADATQRRWWLSLRESHHRFTIGPRERDAWLQAMTATLDDESSIADAGVRSDLLEFFKQSSTYVVNKGQSPVVEAAKGELAALWGEQLALDEAVTLARLPDRGGKCIELLEGPELRARFARSPAIHASFMALAATSKSALLREYAVSQIRAIPSLVHERYKGGRTLLHDSAAAGDLALVELLLDLGAGETSADDKALYCVGNECSAPDAGQIARVLVRRSWIQIDAAHGSKRCTALHMAARRGNADVIGALLDEGADIEARDSMGDTPLRRAVNCDKVDAAKLLLARGADAGSQGSRGLTPRLAARSNRMKQLFLGSF